MKVSTRLSLAEYSLYSGFVVLTLLQVLSLVRVTGPLSQALRLSRLKDAVLEDQVCGQDLILFNYVILRYPLCGKTLKNPVLFPLRSSVMNWSVMLLKLIILLPLCILWLYESDHLRVGYLSRSVNLWFIGILRDA